MLLSRSTRLSFTWTLFVSGWAITPLFLRSKSPILRVIASLPFTWGCPTLFQVMKPPHFLILSRGTREKADMSYIDSCLSVSFLSLATDAEWGTEDLSWDTEGWFLLFEKLYRRDVAWWADSWPGNHSPFPLVLALTWQSWTRLNHVVTALYQVLAIGILLLMRGFPNLWSSKWIKLINWSCAAFCQLGDGLGLYVLLSAFCQAQPSSRTRAHPDQGPSPGNHIIS